MKVLIVEDDTLLREGIEHALAREGYTAETAKTAGEADRLMALDEYSAVLLDLGLPDIDGLTLLKKWRAQQHLTPVLIMTARDALDDRVAGLDAGADDYLIKPFELVELFARLRAIIRRHQGQSDNLITAGKLALDLSTKQVFFDGKPLELPMKEFAILSRLILKKGKTVARETLQQDIYSWNDNFSSNTLEVYIHHLRHKLGKDSIVTVRGMGYRLEEPV